jgi:hypothetical protein
LSAKELVLGCRLVQGADEGLDVGFEPGDLLGVSRPEFLEAADLCA